MLGENGNMKANRKFVEEREAVSAVIGVILMVAITVAIAATVYYYVTTIMPGAQKSDYKISCVYFTKDTAANTVTYTIQSCDEGLSWSKITGKTVNSTTGAVLNVAEGDVDESPAGAANVEVGQTVTVTVTDFTGTIQLIYDGTDLLWTSPSVSV